MDEEGDCWLYTNSLGALVLIPLCYVGSIYLLDGREEHRNHPSTVKKRFIATLLATCLVMALTMALLSNVRLCLSATIVISDDYGVVRFQSHKHPLREMGLRVDASSLLHSVVALSITAVFYLGQWLDLVVEGGWLELFDWCGWRDCLGDVVWMRHTVMAPATEELAFRSCCATLIAHCYGWNTAMVVSPLGFSASHFHHIGDDLRQGRSLVEALAMRTFQALYTYLYGVYATFLLARTGNILAPIMSHSLCNNLGLPESPPLFNYICALRDPDSRTQRRRRREPVWRMLVRTAYHLLGPLLWYRLLRDL